MKWWVLAVFAEVSVLGCLIFAFDGAMQSAATRRLTWDHAAVLVIYALARGAFSWKRIPTRGALPTGGALPRRGALPSQTGGS